MPVLKKKGVAGSLRFEREMGMKKKSVEESLSYRHS
jgi:hypothetical protein